MTVTNTTRFYAHRLNANGTCNHVGATRSPAHAPVCNALALAGIIMLWVIGGLIALAVAAVAVTLLIIGFIANPLIVIGAAVSGFILGKIISLF